MRLFRIPITLTGRTSCVSFISLYPMGLVAIRFGWCNAEVISLALWWSYFAARAWTYIKHMIKWFRPSKKAKSSKRSVFTLKCPNQHLSGIYFGSNWYCKRKLCLIPRPTPRLPPFCHWAYPAPALWPPCLDWPKGVFSKRQSNNLSFSSRYHIYNRIDNNRTKSTDPCARWNHVACSARSPAHQEIKRPRSVLWPVRIYKNYKFHFIYPSQEITETRSPCHGDARSLLWFQLPIIHIR